MSGNSDIRINLGVIAWCMSVMTCYATIAFFKWNGFEADALSKLLVAGVLVITTVLGCMSIFSILAALEAGRRDKDVPSDKG